MDVDTGQFAAVVAEVGMLRERAARSRRRATRDQGGPRRVSPVTAWSDAGYEQAMQSVLETARETARFGTVATLRAVVDLAVGVVELRLPQAEWLDTEQVFRPD